MREEQLNFSDLNEINKRAMYDFERRYRKSYKILKICEEFSKRKLNTLSCLDIGASTGIISNFLHKNFKSYVGMDVDEGAINYANKHFKNKKLRFVIGSAMDIPFPDASFDVIICNQIYEHVPNAKKLVSEISRVLKNDGFAYFGALNCFCINEPHHHLPFLSWMPKWLGNIYLRLAGKKTKYYENVYSYFKLKKLLKSFNVHDFTFNLIHDPKKYHVEEEVKLVWLSEKVPYFVYPFIKPFLPAYSWILTKKN